MTLLAAWGRAFALTSATELVVAAPLLGSEERWLRRVVAVMLAQLATHPAVWFIFPELQLPRLRYLVLAEAWAVVIEAILYATVFTKLRALRAFGIAALANGVSLTIGLLPLFR